MILGFSEPTEIDDLAKAEQMAFLRSCQKLAHPYLGRALSF
jgi:hypothetical protein